MKRKFNSIILAALLLAGACGEDKESIPSLSVNPAELTFGREGGEATFEVSSDSKWTTTNNRTTWYDTDKNAGEKDATITVTVDASELPAERKDTIHLASGVTTAFVVIKQQAQYEDITTFVTDANLKAALLSLFDANSNGKVSSAEVNSVKVADLSGKQIASIEGLQYLTALEELNISNNALDTIDLSRVPFLTALDCSNNQITALDLTTLTDLVTLKCNGNTSWETNYIDISANTQLTTLEVTNSNITYVKVWTGFTTGEFSHAPANELRFRGAATPALSATPVTTNIQQDEVNVDANISINSNLDWTISGAADWINLSATAGHDNATIIATVTSTNEDYSERSATFTVASSDPFSDPFIVGELTSQFTIKQAGKQLPPLQLDKTRIEHAATAGTETLYILSDKQYTITSPETDTWYTPGTTSGTGATNLTITFEANPNPYARLGYIDVTENGTETGLDGTTITAIKRLIVRQEGNATPQDEDLLSTYTPDANFYAALKTYSYGGQSITKSGAGGEITVGDARAYTGNLTGSSIYNQTISSFVGIEFFTGLKQFAPGATGSLNASTHNRPVVIDFSRNVALTHLTLTYMPELHAVDVSTCTELTSFIANNGHQMVELDFTNNTKLVTLNSNGGSTSSGTADVGQLRKVNLANCPNLTGLQLACNKLTELDISQNVNLTGTVYLRRNYLKSLDFSVHAKVTTISAPDNHLETLILPPPRTNTASTSSGGDPDISLTIGNALTYQTDKSFNSLSVINVLNLYTITTINWEGLTTLQKIIVPTYPPRRRAAVNYYPTDVSSLTIEEIDPTAATSSY